MAAIRIFSTLRSLLDAAVVSPGNKQTLIYSSSTGKWTNTTLPRVISITYSATVTPNADTTDVANVGTLTGTVTIANPTGTPTDGQKLTLRLAQDGTGGHVITWGDVYAFGTDVTTDLLPTDASETWEMLFQWHAGSSKWRAVGISRGF